MLPLIPAILIMTMVLSFVLNLSGQATNEHYPNALAGNMLLQHGRVVDEVREDGVGSGNFGNRVTPPMSPLANWRSAAISRSGKTYVLTWRSASGAGSSTVPVVDEDTLSKVMGSMDGKTIPGGGISSSGRYIYSGSGGRIGTVPIEGFGMPISEGEFAVVTVIEGDA